MVRIVTSSCSGSVSEWRHRAACLAVTAALAVTPYAVADTWDNSSGNGQWSTASNWQDNSEPSVLFSDSAVFPAGFPNLDTTITLSSGEFALVLTLNDDYTLTAGSLQISTGGLTTAAGASAIINSALVGSGGLTKLGMGTLVLGGANTFTGAVSVDAGTLQINADSRLGDAANGVTLDGGTLATTSSISTLRTLTMGAAGGTFAPSSPIALTISSALTANANSLTMSGGGRLTLTAASTRTGTTNISSGQLLVTNGSALGTGAINVTGTGQMELSNLSVSQPLGLADSGVIRSAAATSTYTGVVTVAAGATPSLSSGIVNALVINNYTGGSGATTNVIGTGTVTLPVANSYLGGWDIKNGGALKIQNASALGSGASAVLIENFSALEINGVTLNRAITLDTGSTLRGTGMAGSNGTTTVASGAAVALATTSPSDVFTIGNTSFDLTGGGGGSTITVSGGGKVVMAEQNPGYAGNWSVLGGSTLEINNSNNLGPGSNALTLDGGTLLTSGVVGGTRAYTLGAAGGTFSPNAGSTLFINTALTANANSLIKTGEGTLIINTISTRTGSTLANDGVLALQAADGLGSGSIALTGDAEMSISFENVSQPLSMANGTKLTQTAGPSGYSGTIAIASGAAITLNANSVGNVLILGDAADDLTGGGSGSTITVTGAGSVRPTQASNYIGNWIVSGTLEVSADNQLGDPANNVTLSGGTLSATQTFSSARTITPGSTISVASGRTLTLSSGLGAGAGALTKADPGTLAVSVNSSRSGTTTINGGTVRISGSASSLGSGAITVNNGATVELSAPAAITTAPLILNSGATLAVSGGQGTYQNSGSPQIANGSVGSPVTVNFTAIGAADLLRIGTAVRNDLDATPSFATIQVNGAGRVLLDVGGISASDIYGGAWQQSSGVLQVASGGGSAINGLGFKNGDAKQANTITVTGGTLAVGGLGSGANTPAWLRANVILSGGAIASTDGVDGQYGGDFTTTAATISRVLVFDPVSTSTVRNVTLTAGAAGVDNNAATTHWAGRLIIDPVATTGGAFNIQRSGGTILVDSGAILQINVGATVNLGGAIDALSDGVDHVSIVNNSTTSLHVTEGIKTVGAIDGSGNTTIDAGASLSAARFSQNALTVNGTAIARVDAGTSATSVLNQLTTAGALSVTLAGLVPGTHFVKLQVSGNANLAGTLNITRTGGFEPQLSDSFAIITYGSRSGEFTQVTGMSAGPGKVFRVQYNPTIVSLTVGAPAPADFDTDGDVDTDDLTLFGSCKTREKVPHSGTPLCQEADFDDDNDVDGNDFGVYQRCVSGTNVPADPACAQ